MRVACAAGFEVATCERRVASRASPRVLMRRLGAAGSVCVCMLAGVCPPDLAHAAIITNLALPFRGRPSLVVCIVGQSERLNVESTANVITPNRKAWVVELALTLNLVSLRPVHWDQFGISFMINHAESGGP